MGAALKTLKPSGDECMLKVMLKLHSLAVEPLQGSREFKKLNKQYSNCFPSCPWKISLLDVFSSISCFPYGKLNQVCVGDWIGSWGLPNVLTLQQKQVHTHFRFRSCSSSQFLQQLPCLMAQSKIWLTPLQRLSGAMYCLALAFELCYACKLL